MRELPERLGQTVELQLLFTEFALVVSPARVRLSARGASGRVAKYRNKSVEPSGAW
jgi:hypothetical protein